MAKSIHKAQQRKEAFARQYVILGCNAKQAALACGFSPKTADKQGSRLSKNVEVRKLIATLLERENRKHDITVEKTLAQIARHAFADARCLVNDDDSFKRLSELDADIAACINAIERTSDGTKRIKLTDQLRALEMLGRYQHLFAEDRNPVDLGVKIIILDAPRPNRVGFSNAGALPPANGNGKPHNDE